MLILSTKSEKSLKLLKKNKQVYIIHNVARNFVHQSIKLVFLLGWFTPASSKKERTLRLERREKKNETPQQNNLQLVLLVIIVTVFTVVIILVMLVMPIVGFICIIIAICTWLIACSPFRAAN